MKWFTSIPECYVHHFKNLLCTLSIIFHLFKNLQSDNFSRLSCLSCPTSFVMISKKAYPTLKSFIFSSILLIKLSRKSKSKRQQSRHWEKFHFLKNLLKSSKNWLHAFKTPTRRSSVQHVSLFPKLTSFLRPSWFINFQNSSETTIGRSEFQHAKLSVTFCDNPFSLSLISS